MGQGYTRTDTINNIADGNIINAADFDAEYDAIESAFNSSTGHSHDGTSGEGGPVTVLGPAQDFVASTTEIKPKSNNTLDVGTTGLKFKDLYLAGTANLVNVTTTGDLTLTGAANNIVFDASDNALEFADNAKAAFGDATTPDLQIYHDGTDNYIESNAGELYIQGDGITLRSDTDTETYATMDKDGAVALYYDNSKKFETTDTGIAVTGSIALDGIHLDDNEKATFGDGDNPDLEIYHDGTDSIIENNTGELFIQGNNITLRSDTDTETFIAMDKDGAVELYHDNAKKFDTDADGVNVTGQIDVSTNVNLTSDGGIIKLGADEEVTLTHEHNVGVQAKAASGFELNLQTGDTSVESGNVLGKITFNAPDEAGGTDAILDGAAIEAVAEDTFASDNNTTALVFKTNTSGAATERMRIKGDGTIIMDTQVDIDNITIDGNTISSTDTNGSIVVAPNGTGDVQLDADTVRIGDNNANATITTNGTGDLILNTNAGSSSGSITIEDAANGNIALTPNGTGEVDITKVDIDGGAIDGTIIGANSAAAGTFVALEGTTVTASTSLTLASGATVTAILDEDDMSTNSDTAIATQQSIKAFVENTISGGSFGSGITSGGNITLNDDGNSSPNGFGLVFKEASATYTTTLNKTTPTANRTISLPNETGTVSTQAFANGAAVALAIALG